MMTEPTPEPQPSVVRLSVNIAMDVAQALKATARSKRITITEAVRQAICLFSLVSRELRKGNKLVVVEGTGENKVIREVKPW